MQDFEIIEYRGGRNAEVASHILSIQRGDVGLNVPVEEQPELLDIESAYRAGGFWLAVADGDIIGTIGVQPYGSIAVLKKLFVRPEFRGQNGAAHALHDKAVTWAEAKGLSAIFLDTPAVAKRSHTFYLRKGYVIASRSELPADYVFPDRDSLIFKKAITPSV